MKLTLFALTACCCLIVCLASPKPAINEVKNTSKTGDPKGRFLSLPNPQKCANRKLEKIFLNREIVVNVNLLCRKSIEIQTNWIAVNPTAN